MAGNGNAYQASAPAEGGDVPAAFQKASVESAAQWAEYSATLTDPPEITWDVGKGSATISGTITLPDSSKPGMFAQLQYWRKDATANAMKGGGFSTQAKSVKYVISGLEPGTYVIGARFDANADMKVGEPGDLAGVTVGDGDPTTEHRAGVPVDATQGDATADFTVLVES